MNTKEQILDIANKMRVLLPEGDRARFSVTEGGIEVDIHGVPTVAEGLQATARLGFELECKPVTHYEGNEASLKPWSVVRGRMPGSAITLRVFCEEAVRAQEGGER